MHPYQAVTGMNVEFWINEKTYYGKIVKLNSHDAKIQTFPQLNPPEFSNVTFCVEYQNIFARPLLVIPEVTRFYAKYENELFCWKVIEKIDNRFMCKVEFCKQVLCQMFDETTIVQSLEQLKQIQNPSIKEIEFYDLLQIGQILHYSNGNNSWIRCKVIPLNGQKTLERIALLGNWQPHELVTRHSDLSYHYGCHAKAIVENILDYFNPNNSLIWEGCYRKKTSDIDPYTLTPISLELPPPTEKELHDAKYCKIIQKITDIIFNPKFTPEETVNQIASFINTIPQTTED